MKRDVFFRSAKEDGKQNISSLKAPPEAPLTSLIAAGYRARSAYKVRRSANSD